MLHKKYNFDLIVGVHHPLEALVAVHNFKKKHENVKTILYYLDALAGGAKVINKERKFKHFPLKRIFFYACVFWENVLSKYADVVITMESAQKIYSNRLFRYSYLKKMKYLSIPLLEENKIENRVIEPSLRNVLPDDKLVILFCGDLYVLRDPSFIIKIAKNLNRDDLVWVFIGNYYPDYKVMLSNAKAGYPGRFVIYDRMKHFELVSFLERADYFLNIEDGVPAMLPSKIFEYMSYGKPIITTSKSESSPTIKILNDYGNSLVINENSDLSKEEEKLDKFVNIDKKCNVNFKVLKKTMYTSTPDAFVDTVDAILGQ